MLYRYRILSLTLLTLMACQKSEDITSNTLVTNSVTVSEETHPSVALLILDQPNGQSNCTGTFLTSSIVLTAAHCVEGLKNPSNGPLYYVRHDRQNQKYIAAIAEAVTQYPGYDIQMGTGYNDLAIVRFPEGTAPAVAEQGPSPEVGTEITIVGYGNNDFTYGPRGELLQASGALTLRSGRNLIDSSDGNLLYFSGVTHASASGVPLGTQVSAGQGDSGGPMFVDGKLVGVASGVGYGGKLPNGESIAVSAYIDLNSWTSREFLKRVLPDQKDETAK